MCTLYTGTSIYVKLINAAFQQPGRRYIVSNMFFFLSHKFLIVFHMRVISSHIFFNLIDKYFVAFHKYFIVSHKCFIVFDKCFIVFKQNLIIWCIFSAFDTIGRIEIVQKLIVVLIHISE